MKYRTFVESLVGTYPNITGIGTIRKRLPIGW
jgi:hypothetical protein